MEIVDRRFNQSVFLFFFFEFDTIVFALVILRSVTTSVTKCIRIQLVSVSLFDYGLVMCIKG